MSFTGAHAIASGKVLAALRELPDNSVDGALFDPPYGYGNHQPTIAELLSYLQGSELDTGGDFMGNDWHVPSVLVWREIFRVLKPGAPLLSFGGTRTGWLIALGICAAGFELRDELVWLYAKGFPKSFNVAWAIDRAAGITRKGDEPAVTDFAKQWEGWGTALKPAREPIYYARKPLDGTILHNIETWGVGPLAIDAARIDGGERPLIASGTNSAATAMAGWGSIGTGSRAAGSTDEGRWPANVVLDAGAAAMLDAKVGRRPSTPYPENTAEGAVLPMKKRTAGGYADDGGPSRFFKVCSFTDGEIAELERFFYSAKVSTKEREHGCEALPMRSAGEVTGGRVEGSAGLSNPRAGAGRGKGAHNHHPTLKPIALAEWLAALIKPPTDNPTLLIPYSGAGSEMIGALRAGWGLVFGIEQDPDFIEIANARINAWREGEP